MAEAGAEGLPSEETLERHIKSILQERDLGTTSMKEVRALIETKLSLSPGTLDVLKEAIKAIVTKMVTNMVESRPQDLQEPRSPEPDAAEPDAADEPATVKSSKGKGGKKRNRESADGEEGRTGGTKRKQAELLTRSEFDTSASSIAMAIGDKQIQVQTKQFSTGSRGWYHNSKVNMKVGDKIVVAQASIQFIVVGSKEWKE